MFRYCRHCEQSLPLDAFAKSKRGKYGRTAKCRSCQSSYQKAHYQRTRDTMREQRNAQAKAWKARNPDYLREYRKRYYAENAERIKQSTREWRASREDHLRAYRKQYYATNRSYILEKFRLWHKRNKQHRQEYNKEYRCNLSPERKQYRREQRIKHYVNNKEHAKRIRQEWARANPDKVVEAQHRRRARLLNAEGSRTNAEWLEVVWRQRFACAHCGEVKPLTRDHIIPLSKGGSNYISNIQGLCLSCNSRKGAKLPDDSP